MSHARHRPRHLRGERPYNVARSRVGKCRGSAHAPASLHARILHVHLKLTLLACLPLAPTPLELKTAGRTCVGLSGPARQLSFGREWEGARSATCTCACAQAMRKQCAPRWAVAEFKALRQLRTFPRRKELVLVGDDRRGARGGTCPGKIPDKCTLSSLLGVSREDGPSTETNSLGFAECCVCDGAHVVNGKRVVSTDDERATRERGARSSRQQIGAAVDPSQAKPLSPPRMKLPVDTQRATAASTPPPYPVTS